MKSQFKYIRLAKQKPFLLFRGIKNLFLGRFFRKKLIRGIELAVTYQCQAKCEKCSCYSLIDDSLQDMSTEQILYICKQAIDAGVILINFTGGEPLLRNDIIDIISKLNKKQIIVSLSTNGLLLSYAMLKNLKFSGLNVIQVSLNSPIENEHDREIGIQGSYNRVMEGLRMARQLNLEILINTVVTKEMLYSDRISKIADIAKRSGSFLSLILPASVGGWKDKDVNLDRQDYEIIKKWLKMDFVTSDLETCYKKGICPAGIEKVYISPYGDIYPCPFIHNKAGNVLEDNFIQSWRKMNINVYKSCCNIKEDD